MSPRHCPSLPRCGTDRASALRHKRRPPLACTSAPGGSSRLRAPGVPPRRTTGPRRSSRSGHRDPSDTSHRVRTSLPDRSRAVAPTSERAPREPQFFAPWRAGRLPRKPRAQGTQSRSNVWPLRDSAPATDALYSCSFAVLVHRVVFHRIQKVMHVAVELLPDLGFVRITLRGIWLPEQKHL